MGEHWHDLGTRLHDNAWSAPVQNYRMEFIGTFVLCNTFSMGGPEQWGL